MARWQRKARLVIAVAALVFAVVVVFALRDRAPAIGPSDVTPTDPEAVVQSASGTAIRVNRDKEEVRLRYDRLLTYADGSSRMLGVEVTTERAGGRTFTLRADEGMVGKNETEYSFAGNVRLVADDGLTAASETATYRENDGTVRAPGPVEFARGRLSGSGVGMTYNKNSDLLTVLQQAAIRVAPDTEGPGVEVFSGSALISRPEGIMRFEQGMRATRSAQLIQADLGVGHLVDEAERLQRLELRGKASITMSGARVGELESLTGRDIDLRFAADGETLAGATATGSAVIRLAPPAGAASRTIGADQLEVALGPDGATPTSLEGQGDAVITLPAGPDTPTRTVRAKVLRGHGESGRGLTDVRFEGAVQFREAGGGLDRSARSNDLELTLAPGLGDIDQATFRGSVQFVDGELTGTAAAARYGVADNSLRLTGGRLGPGRPRVVDRRLSVDADQIDVALPSGAVAGGAPSLHAAGSVASELRPSQGTDSRMPSMLDAGRPVFVVADTLEYDGNAQSAEYAGNARLSQTETAMKADTITLDERRGDLVATGEVVTTTVLEQEGRDGQRERVASTARAEAFRYEEDQRRAIYTGAAQVGGPQGDLSAARVELFLKPSGKELERAEAYDEVTLVENRRKTTGERLTFYGADERYVVTGAPVRAVDECGRATTGRTLTFERRTSRVVVDGTEQVRTRTQGASRCP